MRRLLPLLLLAGLVALALWWLLGGPAREGAEPGAASGETRSDRSADALAAGLDAGAADPALQRADAGFEEDESPASPHDPSDTFRVRVVNGEDSSPVPFAEVLYLDLAGVDSKKLYAEMRIFNDQEMMLEHVGHSFKTDDQGIALLPKPAEWMWIAARHGARYGTVPGQGRANLEAELEIRLFPVLHVRAHVEDETGAPLAGVTVGYLIGDGFDAQLKAEVPTDERGDAELRHLETHVDGFARGRRNRIVALLPGAELPGVEFALESPPREIVRIVVPRCGAVRVTVLDRQGEPAGDGTLVTLQPVLLPAQLDEWRRNRGSRPLLGARVASGAQTIRTQGGKARFPHVPIGLRLECFASPDGSLFPEAVEADGPQRAGEEVEIRLQQTGVHPLLTGRLVDAAGAPLGKVSLSSTYWRGWPNQSGTQMGLELRELDADSRFSKVLGEAAVPPGTARVLAIHRTLDGDSRMQMAWIFVPEQVPESGLDVGDVPFGGPIAAAGRVERGDGSPVAGVRLELLMQLAPPGQENRAGTSSVTHFLWLTDADGRFSLEGQIPGAKHHLRINPPTGGQPIYQPFTLGTADLRIVLEETGSIQGRVLLDAGIPGDLLYVDYAPSSFASDEEPWSRQTSVDRLSGEFEMRGLEPGFWKLELGLTTSTDPLMTIDGVVVPAGAAAEDPRLQIDLRGKLFLHRLVVIDADGGRPPRLELNLARDGQWQASRIPNPWDFLATDSSLSAIVGAEGWGRTEVNLPGGEVQVRLSRGIPVRIELTGDGPAVAGKEGLLLRLFARGNLPGLGLPPIQRGRAIQPPWTWSVVAPEAGAYQATIFVKLDGIAKSGFYGPEEAVLIDGAREFPIQVVAGTAEQVFRVRLSAAEVTRALERARER